jgi:Ser-tRNA(Ala) deacylase AlaX
MLTFLLHFYSKIFSGYTTVIEIMPTTVKDDVDTDVEDETVEEQTALKNILSSKDTPLHTEYNIKEEEEEENEDGSLRNSVCVIKHEEDEEQQLSGQHKGIF